MGTSLADLRIGNERSLETEVRRKSQPTKSASESTLEPQEAVVQGYEKANKMVDIRKTLDEKQTGALVQFPMDARGLTKQSALCEFLCD